MEEAAGLTVCIANIDMTAQRESKASMRTVAHDLAFPVLDREQTPNGTYQLGLTKREWYAGIALHAEFLSCGMHRESAEALAEAAEINGQSVEQRMAVNALAVADAMLLELAKPREG